MLERRVEPRADVKGDSLLKSSDKAVSLGAVRQARYRGYGFANRPVWVIPSKFCSIWTGNSVCRAAMKYFGPILQLNLTILSPENSKPFAQLKRTVHFCLRLLENYGEG